MLRRQIDSCRESEFLHSPPEDAQNLQFKLLFCSGITQSANRQFLLFRVIPIAFPNLVTPKINLNNFFDTIQFNVCVLLACLRFWRQKSQFCREILCTMDQEIERSQFLRFDFLPSFLHTHSLSLLLPLSISPSQAAVD